MALAFAASLFVSAATSRAATYTYTPTTNGATDQWSAGTNWAGGVPISSTATELKFMTNSSNSGTYNSNNDIAGTFVLNKLTYSGANWGENYNITGNAVKFSGPDRVINLDSTVSSVYFYFKIPAIAADGPLTIQGSGIGLYHFYSKISNGTTAASLVKSGSSKVTLWYTSDYTGGTTLNAGTLSANATNALGSGPITINGGKLDVSGGTTFTNNNVQAWNGDFAFTGSGSGNLNLGTGAVTLGGNRAVTVSGRALIVGGSINDGGNAYGLTKLGTGTLTLSGSSSYTGATTVKSGTLNVSGALSDNSAVTVGDSGSLAAVAVLGGSGTVGNVIALGNSLPANTGASIDPGNSVGVAGVLSTINLSVTNGAHLAMQIGGRTPGGNVATGYDQVVAEGSVNITGGDLKLAVNGTPFLVQKDVLYLVVNNSGSALTGTFGSVTLNGTAVSDVNNIVINGRQFQLVYNAQYEGAGSDGIANDIALVAVAGLWQTVPIGGGGYVIGLVTDSTGNSIYCHTDVGGAFRWDSINGEWVSITDAIVSSTTISCDRLSGILSLAIDPTNSNKLYVAAGLYTSDPLHGIFASNDGGATWTQINSSIVVNGNGSFRATGERLAVDPNNPNILWFGSSQDGLQKGVCTSGSWAWTQVPSTSVPFGQVASGDKAGVTFVACDKSGTNTIVYAGVYDSVGSTGGIYSTSNGTNWAKVSGISLARPYRGQVAPNGTLYVTQSGTVGKLLRGGALTPVTPVAGVIYWGVAVDPSDSSGNTLYVAERTANGGSNCRIWRSTDGGTSWPALQSSVYIRGGELDGTPSASRSYWFTGTDVLMVSATNSNELWVGDYLGVMRTQDAQNIGTTSGASWNSLQKGQEEVCVSALKSPPSGPALISAVADVAGFRHNDVTVRPVGAGGNAMNNPTLGSTSGLDFCEAYPNVLARGWDNAASNGGTGGVSLDGGVTWMVFGQVARKTVSNDSSSRWESWDVGTYLSRQKAKNINTVTLVIACGSSSTSGTLYFNAKEAGATISPRLLINGTTTLTTIADSFVSNTGTSNNYGANADLQVAYYGGANAKWAYLKFDLLSVPAITSATLNLNIRSTASPKQLPVGVYGCTNTTWIEGNGGTDNLPAGELTWTNKPVPLSSKTDPIGAPTYYDGSAALVGGRVAVSATNPNIMVWMPEGITNVPHFSDDCGVTWTSGTGAPVSQIQTRYYPGAVLQPLTADRVNGKFYVAKFAGGGNTHIIYTSTNGGANWVVSGTVPSGTNNVWRAQIVAAPAANDVWVSDDGISGTTAGGLWHSTNGGATWGTKLAGITAVRQVTFGKALSGTGYTVFINGYKNGANGIYRSDDYGATWVLVDISPTVNAIDVLEGDRQNYGSVYLGTSGRGIFQGQ